MPTIVALLLILLMVAAGAAADLPAWEFNQPGDLQGWTGNAQMHDLRVADGCLRATAGDDDPILVGPLHPFASSVAQRIEIGMASDRSGTAEFFWAPDAAGPDGGFRSGREVRFEVTGDAKSHVYTLYPFWQGDPQVVRLRFDPPDNARIAVDYIRVTELSLPETTATRWDFGAGPAGWQALRDVVIAHVGGMLSGHVTGPAPMIISPRLRSDTAGLHWLSVRMRVDAGRAGEAQILTGGSPGMARRSFPLTTDGRFHTYNVLAAGPQPGGAGIIGLGLAPSLAQNAKFEIESIALGAQPGGKADISPVDFGPSRAVVRAGRSTDIVCALRNRGGAPVHRLRATLDAPAGVTIAGSPEVVADADLSFASTCELHWSVTSARPRVADLAVRVEADNVEPQTFTARVDFAAPQPAKPAIFDGKPYVPEPAPVRGDWQVGVYYFPGWKSAGSWAPIARARFPIPYLGFYREGDPEVADWHIKWAVEHGISFFVYDWYWCQGATSLMHALHDGYLKARYRDDLKFCLLWANHNPPHTSSEADLLAVTRFWLDNYFKLPQYQTVEGKPLVVIFAPGRFREDMGSEAVRAAFDKMRAMCKAEGLPGLYLAACGMPGDATKLAREGYDAATGYNYPGVNAAGELWAPYDTMVTGYEGIWRDFFKRDEIKYIVPVSPGWDNRPWAGDEALVRYGNTPPKFEDMCRRAKSLLAARPPTPESRMVIIEAWNEFGEGSYIEPTRPFGFGSLDAVRGVFTDAPRAHVDVVPEDVGLGPYDVPMQRTRRAWEFEKPGDDEGWGSTMQMTDLRVEGGSLKATTTGNDPAFFGPPVEIDAGRYRHVLIRVRIDKPGSAQLFWSTDLAPESEATSHVFPLIADGSFREYNLDLGKTATWAGQVRRLRLDPGSTSGAHVEIDYIRVAE